MAKLPNDLKVIIADDEEKDLKNILFKFTLYSNSINIDERKESVMKRYFGTFPGSTVVMKLKHENVQRSHLKPTRLKEIKALSLTLASFKMHNGNHYKCSHKMH